VVILEQRYGPRRLRDDDDDDDVVTNSGWVVFLGVTNVGLFICGFFCLWFCSSVKMVCWRVGLK